MSRYLEIVKKLVSINDTKFQELCDQIFYIKHMDSQAFGRTGSMLTKEKTTKGTPDSFVMLSNGNFAFMEATTDVSNKKKLKNDIESCFTFSKTNIEATKIEKIVLFFTWEIKSHEVETLKKLAKNYNPNVQTEFWSIEKIACEINISYNFLAREYLELPLDTGQIVNVETFKKEFSRSAIEGISTSLYHAFLYRETEQEQLFQDITQSDFIIISGQAGVGKTKFSLEVLARFVSVNGDYKLWCLSNKGVPFESDLVTFLDPNTNCILFIDDGNKVENLNQIILFYKGERRGKLKVVISVRDYALEEIKVLLFQYNPSVIKLEKFTDDEILGIIKEEPLLIRNHIYFDPILSIADGNIRLAILVAQLAKKHQNLKILSDVTEVFDIYYGSIRNDKRRVELNINQRILALVYFFNIIKIDDKTEFDSLIKPFNIKYSHFNDAIIELEQMELVDINYGRVKISEQNFGLYMFKLSFLSGKDDMFYRLLDILFEKNNYKIKDILISSVNLFGISKVKDAIFKDVMKYWNKIKNQKDLALAFIDVFWFYLQNESLDFIAEYINELPYSVNSIDEVDFDVETKSLRKEDPLTGILGNMLYHDIIYQKRTLEILLEYLKKKPELVREVTVKIIEKLIFKQESINQNYLFQNNFFTQILLNIRQGNSVAKKVFLNICPEFLKSELRYSQHDRKGTIRLMFHKPGLQKSFIGIRNEIWKMLKLFIISDKEKVLEILEKIRNVRNENVELIQHDIPIILEILSVGCDSNDVIDCIFVHRTVKYFENLDLDSDLFPNLLLKFSNKDFLFFQDFNYDFWFECSDHINLGHRKLKLLKVQSIKNIYIFNKKEDFMVFYTSYKRWFVEIRNSDFEFNGFDIMIEANFENNFEIGIQILETIIKENNSTGFIPFAPFISSLKNERYASEILKIIQNNEFQKKDQWLLVYLRMLDEKIISLFHCQLLLQTLINAHSNLYVNLGFYEKYLYRDNLIFKNLFLATVEKNRNAEPFVLFWADSLYTYFDNFGDDIEIIKECYLQQRKLGDHFDYDGKVFQKICYRDKNFIIEFIDILIADRWIGIADPGFVLGFVWEIDDIESIIFEILVKTIELEVFSSTSESFANIFFKSVNLRFIYKSENFIHSIIKNQSTNSRMINAIFDVIIHSIPNEFEKYLLLYLNCNDDVSDFKKINWYKTNVIYGGEASFAVIHSKEWEKILKIIIDNTNALDFLEIKAFIEDVILLNKR